MPLVPAAHLSYEAPPIKRSRFVANVWPVSSREAAAAHVDALRSAHPDATHHVWALRLKGGDIAASDDGEPSGTGGRPILARLEGGDLVDVLVVVSRWYGGTKLGTGGLVRAYGGTAGEALAQVELVPWQERSRLTVTVDWQDVGLVEVAAARSGLEPVERMAGASVHFVFEGVRIDLDALADTLIEGTSGRARLGRGRVPSGAG